MRPPAVAVRDGAEEGGDGREGGGPRGAERGEELVQEGGRAVEEERFRAVVEVAVLGAGLGVALRAVERQPRAVEGGLAGCVHVAEQGAVEGVVVAREEVVVAGEGGVAFEFLRGGSQCDGDRNRCSCLYRWILDYKRRRTLWPFNPSSSPSRSPVVEVREVASQPMDSFSVMTSPSKAMPRVASNTARS